MVTATIELQIASGNAQETFKERSGDLKLIPGRKSGHFEEESQDISKTKVWRCSGHFASESQETSGP
jgi:hypothetical protein